MEKRYLLSAILAISLAWHAGAEGLPVTFDHLTVAHGLSENAVICLFQDSRGFVWIGTHDGLNRYDGYRFSVYNHDPTDPRSLSNNIVQSLCEDRMGTIWVGTSHGLNRLEADGSGFIRYFYDDTDPGGLSGNRVGCILEDREGDLWVGTHHGGLNVYDRAKDRFHRYPHYPGENRNPGANSVTSLLEDGDRRLWVGTNGAGLIQLDRDGETCRSVPLFNEGSSNGWPFIGCLLQTPQGIIWVGTRNEGLFRLDPSNGGIRRYASTGDAARTVRLDLLTSVIDDANGDLWVGTYGGGLHRLKNDGGGFERFFHDASNPGSLSHDQVTDVCIDRTGILWVGTEGGGINMYSPLRNQFVHLRHDPLEPNSLGGDFVHPIFADRNGVLWIGTTGAGLTRYHPKTGRFTRYRHRDGSAHSLASDNVQAICQDPAGNLWVGTDRGLSRCRPSVSETLEFYNYLFDSGDEEGLGGGNVLSLHMGSSGVLWVGTDLTLDRYDETADRFTHFSYAPRSRGGDRSVHAIHEDLDGGVWVGTWGNGLFLFHGETGIFEAHHYDHRRKDGISHNVITSFWQAEKDVLWIGTYGGGLNRLDLDRMVFTHYTQKDGLPNNVVYGILPDGEGRLWLSTNGGLSCFDPRDGSFFNYDEQDGLQSNEFNRSACCRTRDGRLWFGGINGISVFHPGRLRRNTTPPPVVITSFKVFNREVPLDWGPAEKEGIVLPYRLNFFSFEFASLDYTAPKKNRYAYRLEGLDDDWVDCGERRYAAYTNLPPGKYSFQVKGSNDAGVWNEAGIAIPIVISPAFWQTTWFRLLLVLALGMVLALVVFFTIRHLRLLQAKARAENFAAMGRFASYFAHDLKSPVEGTFLIASELIKMFPEQNGRRRHLTDVVDGIGRIRELVGEALDFSKAQNPRRVPSDLNGLVLQAKDRFQGRRECRFDLHLDSGLPPLALDPALVRRVIVNLFDNSHQARLDDCRITVTTRREENSVILEIVDNGRGIGKDRLPHIFQPFTSDKERGFGFGLAFVQETVKSHGGRIEAASTPGVGSRFQIKFPLDSSGIEET